MAAHKGVSHPWSRRSGMAQSCNNNPNTRVNWDDAASTKLLRLYGEGAEFTEIAEGLGCTKSATHQQLFSLRQVARWAEQLSAAESGRARHNVKHGGRRKGGRNPNAGNRDGFRSPSRVARGKRISETMIEVGVILDDETFGEIAERAQRAERSFSAEVRELIEIALVTVKAEGI